MSGILTAFSTITTSNYLVTLGAGGGGADVVGYSSILGSIIPTDTFKGFDIVELSSSSTWDFLFTLTGDYPQALFNQLIVENGSGNRIRYNTSAASYSSGGGFTQWRWGTGTSRPWVAGDAGEVHDVTVQ